MSGTDGPADRKAGALAIRLVAFLTIAAALLFGVIAFGISRLDREPGGGVAGYRMPGTSATLDPLIVTVLAACSIGAGLVGLGLLLASPAPFPRSAARPLQPRSRRSAIVLAAGLLALAVAVLLKGIGR